MSCKDGYRPDGKRAIGICRELNAEEWAFAKAMYEEKMRTRKMTLQWADVLRVAKSLGYRKQDTK